MEVPERCRSPVPAFVSDVVRYTKNALRIDVAKITRYSSGLIATFTPERDRLLATWNRGEYFVKVSSAHRYRNDRNKCLLMNLWIGVPWCLVDIEARGALRVVQIPSTPLKNLFNKIKQKYVKLTRLVKNTLRIILKTDWTPVEALEKIYTKRVEKVIQKHDWRVIGLAFWVCEERGDW